MTTDELKALLAETTPGPWSVPHLAREDVTCNCGYVFAGYGGMGSIATINAAESNRHPWGDDNGPCLSAAKANARLIAQAPALAAEVISLREQKARLVGALAAAMYACRVVDEAVKEGHQSLPALVNHFLQAVEPARAALANEPDAEYILAAEHECIVAEARDKALEDAAKMVDCGCECREAVLSATTKTERWRACGRDPCGALDAADIRAMKA